MSSQLAPRSSHITTSLTKSDTYDLQELAQQTAKITEVIKVANHEIAQIGAHAVSTTAQLVKDAGEARRQMMDSGHRSEIFDDAQSKTLQVTGTNIITLANTAQKEVLNQATKYMR